MVATLSVSSRNCYLLRRTLLFLLRPIARLRIKYQSGPSPGQKLSAPGAARKSSLGLLFGGQRFRPAPARAVGPILKATEQCAGLGHQGAPKKLPWTAIWGAEIPASARCQTKIEGLGEAHWRGPPRRPEKAALDLYLGKPKYRPAPKRATRPILRAAEQRTGGATQAPRKSGSGPLFVVMRTPSPLYR